MSAIQAHAVVSATVHTVHLLDLLPDCLLHRNLYVNYDTQRGEKVQADEIKNAILGTIESIEIE